MATQSIYRPIDGPDTIRLLRLLKGVRHYDDDPIRCELFEAPLPEDDDDEAYYDALSYTWGDAAQTSNIVIDGRPATVTANLYQALRHLRLTDEDRILWVDAICINQGDHSERMHQVGKMGNIYKKAREVIIWLGTTTSEIELLFDAVLFLDKQMLKTPKPRVGDPTYLETWMGAAWQILAEMKQRNAEFHDMRARGLKDLLSREWWSRIWVVQEAANASRARIHCSWRSVPTRTFALMPRLMDIHTGPGEKALLEVLPGPLRKLSWWNSDRSLTRLLMKFQHSQSKEECDQVYALLSISSETAARECTLMADYSLDITRVLQNTVSFIAFGEVVDLNDCPLPAWNLSNLRTFLPSLKPCLFAWAFASNQPVLIRKLLHSEPPYLAVNNCLLGRTGLLLSPQVKYLLPTQIYKSLANFKGSPRVARDIWYLTIQGREDIDDDQIEDVSTPLSLAKTMGRWDLIRLLSARPDMNLTQIACETPSPLDHAVEIGDWGAIEALITLDRKILETHGWMLLHQAIELGRPYIIQMLLSYEDVDVNRGSAFFTPLSLAASLGHTKLIQLLITRQDLRLMALDPAGYSPLERAFQGGRNETAALLLTHGGGLLPKNREAYFLREAVRNNWPAIIKRLAQKRPDLHATVVKYQPSPLILAIKLKYLEAVQSLLEAGADPDPPPPPNSRINTLEVNTWCPIVSAIRSNSPSLLETLLSTGRGAHKRTWNTPGEDPLIYAIRRRHAGMVQVLLARGADVEARTEGRKLPSFWLAVEYNAPRIMRLLADSGADFTISSSSHPQVYQGRWGLKFTPWFREFLEERELSAADVWRFEPGEEVVYNKTPLTRWEWETAGPERYDWMTQ